MIVCMPPRIALLQPDEVGGFWDSWSWIGIDVGEPTCVGAGELNGHFGPDFVFGGPSLDGPRIVCSDDQGLHDTTPSLPPANWSPAPAFETVLLADMDGDGDTDVVHELRMLRNDGGVFTRLSNVGPRGVLLDSDFDGCADLFTGTDLLRNRHTLLHERNCARPGVAWTLEVHCWRPVVF